MKKHSITDVVGLRVHQPEKTKWNLSDSDLAGISSRTNYKYEDYFNTPQEALDNAKQRKQNTKRTVYIFSTPDGYVVCVHGIEKTNWQLIQTL